MNTAVYLVLLTTGACIANFRGEYYRRFVDQKPSVLAQGRYLVECPVCNNTDRWLTSMERCPIEINGKTYKRCEYGMYVNEMCENKLDCYRGAGEECSEYMLEDYYGQKCARGHRCNPILGICTGWGYSINSSVLAKIGDRYLLRNDVPKLNKRTDYQLARLLPLYYELDN